MAVNDQALLSEEIQKFQESFEELVKRFEKREHAQKEIHAQLDHKIDQVSTIAANNLK